jgi:hypothetical protein
VAEEKRTAYRITEDALLDVRRVAAGADPTKPAESLFDIGIQADALTRLNELDQGFRECHARLAREAATAAEACNWLAAQIDLLKDIIIATSVRSDSSLRRGTVSLGANGLGFTYDQALPVGTVFAFRLVLLPQHEAVLGYARVRQVRAEDGTYAIGAEFVDLASDHQRRLNRHMLKSQISSKAHRQ